MHTIPVRSARPPWLFVLALLALLALSVGGCGPGDGVSGTAVVVAASHTEPVAGTGDDADDPAIWQHPSDPGTMRILGTNKDDEGGLHVYDDDGDERQFPQVGALNNVDVRYALDGLGDYAASSNRTTGTVDVFSIVEGAVAPAGSFDVPGEPYGFCLGVLDGVHHAVVTYQSGELRQYELAAPGGVVRATQVRSLDLGEQLEGCVVDDERGTLYVGEEARGVHELSLDPGSSTERIVVDVTADGGNLVPDVEGLALSHGDDADGYLLVSSQGADRIDVYRRGDGLEHRGSFRVVASDGDEVSETDGIEVAVSTGGVFDSGLLVIHDGDHRHAGASNFKLVRWDAVVEAMGLG